MAIECFESTKTGFEPGITLIEASAGTGKTYAIAMLALRFIVEKGMRIDELLIVTFTNAATEELRDRVRLRLTEAKRAVYGGTVDIDPNIIDWINNLSMEKSIIKLRLEAALIDIDKACIFTIHGFCQRVLKEHALESGQLFDCELSGDISAIRQSCADDFWRQQVYQRPIWEAALLKGCFDNPDELLSSLISVLPNTTVIPDPEDLDGILESIFDLKAKAATTLSGQAEIIRSAVAENKFKNSFVENFEEHLIQLHAWLNEENHVYSQDALSLLTMQRLKGELNGHKFRAKGGQSGEERKEEYLATLNLDTEPFDHLLAAHSHLSLMFRRALVEYLDVTLEQRLQQLNLMSYDELISRLSEVLSHDHGKLLSTELRKRFKAALIDEFQDTDQRQWLIFSTLFASEPHYLFLIGDPKQAIYKFRGADIFSYFAALKQAQHLYTLERNWRSHPLLVAAVNTLFEQRGNPFLFDELSYLQIKPGLTSANGALTRKEEALPPLVMWQLKQSDNKQGTWTSGKASLEIQVAVVNEILNLLDEQNVFSLDANDNSRLQPKDIAILVRTNKQALEYQNRLRDAGVPSVLNSTESVYASEQALQLFILLRAIAQPTDTGLIKQALTLSWFNLDGRDIYHLGNDEQLLDNWLTRFQDYHLQWQKQGLMTMMINLLAQEQIQVQISQSISAERQLTNLQHLLELLQQAAVEEHLGINKTLEWLHSAIADPVNNDDQQLRLESDEQAVRIVTMHRAKGLEFPVVFCPCLWDRNKYLKTEKNIIKCHENDEILTDLGSEDFESHRQQALFEERAEDLRIFYVAVTRAKYRCYIAWADVRTKEEPNHSAMSYLLFDQPNIDYAQQQQVLSNFSIHDPEIFEYQSLTPGTELDLPYQVPVSGKKLTARRWTRHLESAWQMSSYTALSALSLNDVPELPEDKVQESLIIDSPDAGIENLPKGAHTGNVVHELLEKNDFAVLAAGGDISDSRNQACLRYGLALEAPEILDALLKKVVKTPLSLEDPGFCLENMSDLQCLKEMPFYLALNKIEVNRINRILKDSPAYQALSARQMQGYLTGFIDLVCEYQGRYYVMDYKTNSLPDYRKDSLTASMRDHNYGLQYWLYSLVLHLYLQGRIPDYHYSTHFGGVRYLYVRGMEPEQPASGVYQDLPDLNRIEALAELLGGPL